MSRMIAYAYLGLLATAGTAAASDGCCYSPGQKPFHPPRSPKPAGVLADTCFGYFQTRWTPWAGACATGPCGTLSCTPGCGPASPSAVILFDQHSSTSTGTVMTPPPAQMPAPAPKK